MNQLIQSLYQTVNDTLSDISSVDDEDYQETFEEDHISEDWIDELDQKDIQLMTKMTYFVKQFKFMEKRAT